MMFDAISHDLLQAARALRRTPRLTLFAVVVLTVGIGTATALFSVTDQVVFRALPFDDPDRLVAVHEILPMSATPRSPVNAGHFEEWRAALDAFEDLSLLFPVTFTLVGPQEPEPIGGARVSASFFSMIGLPVLHGRGFLEEEDAVGRDRVVVLTYDLWQRRFGGDPALIGTSIRLDGEAYTVVGVLGPAVQFPDVRHLYPMTVAARRLQIWKPAGVRPSERDPARAFNFACIGRLKPGVSRAQALAELNAIQREIGRRLPGNVELKGGLTPLHDQITGGSRAALNLLLAAAAVVLLVACVNIANLFLVRGIARRQEVAIQQALGAPRLRLFRRFLAEAVLLTAAAGGLGALSAPTLIRLILASAPVELPRAATAMLDGRALMFGASLSVICSVVLGALPAWRASRVDMIEVLKAAPKGASRVALAGRLGSLLVAIQTAASTTCIVVAGLLLASFTNVMGVDPGFDTGHIISGELRLPATRYDAARASRFLLELKQRTEGLGDVVAAGISDRVPLSGEGGSSPIALEGRLVARLERPVASLQLADGTYFRALGIPVLAGRVFDELDRLRPPVAVLSASAAEQVWSGQNPIGKRFRIGDDSSPLIEIIGIVGDVRGVTLESQPRLSIYLPYWHVFVGQASLTVRTRTDSTKTVPEIRDAIRRLDPDLALPTFRSIDEIVDESVRMRRFQTELALLLATVAVLLACLGIYATLSQSSRARAHEIGIRVALGASRADIVRLVYRRAMTPVGIGLMAGCAGALALAPVLQGLLFGVAATDVRLFALAASVLGTVATAAAYLPAHRASRASPLLAREKP